VEVAETDETTNNDLAQIEEKEEVTQNMKTIDAGQTPKGG